MQAHRRGGLGRPSPMRRANPSPGARPRRNRRRPTGTVTRQRQGPPATGRTLPASQSRQHDPAINSPPRAGQARPSPQPRAPLTTSGSGNRAASGPPPPLQVSTLATRRIPPLSPTVMRRNIADRARNFGHFFNSIEPLNKNPISEMIVSDGPRSQGPFYPGISQFNGGISHRVSKRWD